MKMIPCTKMYLPLAVAMALLGTSLSLTAGDTNEQTPEEQRLITAAQRHIEQAWKKNQDQGDIQRVSCTFTSDEVCVKTDFSDYRKKRDRYTKPNKIALSSPITEITFNPASNKQSLFVVTKKNSTRRLQEKHVPIPAGSFLSTI
ncbi:MAG: hypothetical protein WCW33_04895 [Candidatus Babeliales bacterium]